MPKTYEYEQLASISTIRLIKLEKEKVDDQIACTIRHAEQAAEDTKYNALSYVWGDPKPTREIRIRNNLATEWDVFQVHENLWQFLNQAWQRKIFDRWFWTDRICLDQSHGSSEKADQIPRMAGIYHDAEQVVAWLGLAIETGKDLIPLRKALVKGGGWPFGFAFAPKTDAALSAVHHAEYWSRIWVVQEIVSAKRIVCVVGDLELGWRQMVRLVGMGHWHTALLWQRLRLRYEIGNLDWWSCLLVASRSHRSTKPHDVVYGILGLAIVYDTGASRLDLIRKADYEESPAYVVIDALLESFPDHRDYGIAMDLLLRKSFIPDLAVFTVLGGYIKSTRTSNRHKRLAGFLLQTCDACFSIFSPLQSASSWPSKADALQQILGKMLNSLLPGSSFRTPQQNAVLLGLTLALGISETEEREQIFRNWKAARGIQLEVKGTWRFRAQKFRSQRPRAQTIRSRRIRSQKFRCQSLHAHKCRVQRPSETHPKERSAVNMRGPIGKRSRYYKAPGRNRETSVPLTVGGTASVSLPNLDLRPKERCSSSKKAVGSWTYYGPVLEFRIPEAGFRLDIGLSRHDALSGVAGKSISVWFSPPLQVGIIDDDGGCLQK